jgi:large subunit ribosomal protein L3
MLDEMLGKKVGMTQVYDETGTIRPVTVIQLGPCTVMQVKTDEVDGYTALQLGFGDRPRRTATKPSRGIAEKAKTEPKRFVREVRVSEIPEECEAGTVLTAAEFEGAGMVDVTGVSKGRGFAGVIKRWGFHGSPASHGASKNHRRPGSIGQSASPARVMKGMRMPGHYGNARCTVKNLKVVKLDPEKNLLLVQGGVPGPNGGFVCVRVIKRETAAS